MKKIKQSMVALRATALAFVAFVAVFCLAPMTAFAASGLDGKAAEEPVTRAATGGLDLLTCCLIVAVAILVIAIIVFAIIRAIKGNRTATARAIREGQQAVVGMINPNYKLNDGNVIVEEAPVNRRTDNAGQTIFSSPTNGSGPAVVPNNNGGNNSSGGGFVF